MTCVILESPYKAKTHKRLEYNLLYARCAMRDCLMRGEAPFASHLLYTQPSVLDDDLTEERAIGMAAGYAWAKYADYIVVYRDLGISTGMRKAIRFYKEMLIPIRERKLDNWNGKL